MPYSAAMADDDDEDKLGLISGIMTKTKFRTMHNSAMHYCVPRFHVKKFFLGILAVTILLIVFYFLKGSDEYIEVSSYVPSRLKSPTFCAGPLVSMKYDSTKTASILSALKSSKTRSPGKVLLVPKTSYSRAHKAVTEILSAHRIGFKSSIAGKNLPDLIKVTKNLGKYGVIFFEDYRSYLDMDPWNRDILDKYCQTYKVGIIAFIPSEEKPTEKQTFADKSNKIGDTPIPSHRNNIEALEILGNSAILSMTKPGLSILENDHKTWVTLPIDNSKYKPIALGHFSSNNNTIIKLPTVLLDPGDQDGIPKVLFGSGVARHWLYKLLFLDALQYLSNGLINFPLLRYILIDIDDIFVGSNRLTTSDVQALISSQETISNYVPGFRYNLGFSGKTFKTGTTEEDLADELLIKNRHKFWWFPHMWHHLQPHMFDNVTELERRMTLNL